ncbi:hypothetical protein C8Q78DRAFT_1074864 [Trametes maxima]|nr:hypothetical protein C8Q78DRAFT_1074864 [Trametes maxima]
MAPLFALKRPYYNAMTTALRIMGFTLVPGDVHKPLVHLVAPKSGSILQVSYPETSGEWQSYEYIKLSKELNERYGCTYGSFIDLGEADDMPDGFQIEEGFDDGRE